MGAEPKIAILGAGMGGLATAAMLCKFGANISVYEQAPAFARVGAGIQMSPNAVRVMRTLGLEERIRQVAFQRNRQWDTGAMQFELELGAKAEAAYGAPYLLLHRAELHEALLSCVPSEVLALGKKLIDVKQTRGSIALTFADGSQATADILIAADGINSRVREIFFRAQQPRLTGRVTYRTVFPAARLGDLVLDDNAKWWGPDRHIVIYYLNARRDEVYFTTSVPDPNWTKESWSATGDLGELRAAFVGFHDHVTRVVAACPHVHKWAIADRDPMPDWSHGRVLLLGDSCHPMTPYMAQGAAQAMEDAVVLARSLQHYGFGDVESAFATYQATRHARTSKIQITSHGNTWMRQRTDGSEVYNYNAETVPLVIADAGSGNRATAG
jgi:6-hydroxynicotinate 3-monooxygenase